MKKGIEGNTRPFRVFGEGELAAAFEAHGFRSTARRPEFAFPMALHRGIGVGCVARAIEGGARLLGLTHLVGSPVVRRWEPRG
jgi:hypothetical protein